MEAADERLDRFNAALVDELLASLRDVEIGPWTPSNKARHQIRSFADQLPTAEQIALLKGVVARMPSYRRSLDPTTQRDGTLLYEAAVGLYEDKLSLDEADLADLLTTSRHDCGHGADTRPPFDLARVYMRKHGYSPLLGAAIHVFIDNLPNTMTTKVRELRRSTDSARSSSRPGSKSGGRMPISRPSSCSTEARASC